MHTLLCLVPTTIDLIGPVTNNLMIGDSLTLQCVVNTVENIMSSVDIVWRSDGELLEGNNGVTGSNMNGSVVYSDSYTFEALNSSGTLQCQILHHIFYSVAIIISVPGVPEMAGYLASYTKVYFCYNFYMSIYN